MKKILLAFGLILAAITTLPAKEFDSVFNEFKDKPDAEYVKMPGLLIRMASSRFIPS